MLDKYGLPAVQLDLSDAVALSLPEFLMGMGPGAGGKMAAKLPLAAVRRGAATLAEKSRASKSAIGIYDPPNRPQREFRADYRSGAGVGPGEPLELSMDRQPLNGGVVVGRQVEGGPDVPFPPAKYRELTTVGTGKAPVRLSPDQMEERFGPGTAGAATFDKDTGIPLGVYLSKGLTPEDALRAHAHENSHVIEAIVGLIPTKGLMPELKSVYNTLNNPNRAGAEAAAESRRVTPKSFGYKGDRIAREYVAEAIRAYKANPNYFKTEAPKTAATIREVFNTHPYLSRFIQFNTAAGIGALPLLDADPAASEGLRNDAIDGNPASVKRKPGLSGLSIPPEYYNVP